jgi:hypothetical protein
VKIISLQAENFKKLQAIEITPDGNFVQITGKNGQGKSSTLDAIWVALAGLGVAPKQPIRKGAESAKIRLDLGEIIVTRHFKQADSGAFTTSLTVESAKGARYPSPQKMLDSLIGALSFDPIAFIGMEPKEQFNYCRRFVPDVDFDEFALADSADRTRRTEIGKLQRQEESAAVVIVVPPNTPVEETDITALTEALGNAAKNNLAEEQRKNRYDNAVAKVAELRVRAQTLLSQIDKDRADRQSRYDRQGADIERQIRDLRLRADRLKEECDAEYKASADRLTDESKTVSDEANELQIKVDGAKEFERPIDTTELAAQIEAARKVNLNVAKLIQRNKHASTAKTLKQQYDALTAQIAKREADKRAAIGAAKFPVEGLTFGDGAVLLNEFPLEQASDAEKLRVSVALGMAANPKLKVVFIRNGSLLDEDGLRLVSEMADKNDVQVWVERVASDGKVGIVLENGLIKAHEETT